MKIAINAVAALQGGGVTYLNELLIQLGGDKDLQFDVYGFKKADSRLSFYDNIKLIEAPEEVYTSIRARRNYEKYVLSRLIEKGNYSVAFYPSGTIPGKVKGDTKLVTTFQNMLPFSKRDINKFPSFKARLRYHVLRYLFLKSFKKADHVIFISNYAKSVIQKYIPNIDYKSSVVVHGINDAFRLNNGYNKDGYLLYVSIFNVYKHQKEIVEGLAMFKKENGWAPKIVLAGFIKESYLYSLEEKIKSLGVEDEVNIYGPAEYHELPNLYKGAKAVVFGSTCENCPIILLEAMATGKPVLCSTHQPMPEFLEDKGFYFDPEKPKSFAKVLNDYIENDEILSHKALEAQNHAMQWTWEAAGKKMKEVFVSLA